METDVDIVESEKGDVIILRVKGKLDSLVSSALEKKALGLIDAGQDKLVLDLGEVSYVNSSGLRTILAIKKQMKTLPGKLVLCGCRTEILEVMKICGFDHVLDIISSEEEALRQLKS